MTENNYVSLKKRSELILFRVKKTCVCLDVHTYTVLVKLTCS